MSALFFDTSALVKRYARETGTSWIIGNFKTAANNRIYVSRVTSVEVIAAITRRVRVGSITTSDASKAITRFRRLFKGTLRKVEITNQLIEEASALAEKHFLRAYDAIQLASVLEIQQQRVAAKKTPIVLISADDALNMAATAEGLSVDNPNNHP